MVKEYINFFVNIAKYGEKTHFKPKSKFLFMQEDDFLLIEQQIPVSKTEMVKSSQKQGEVFPGNFESSQSNQESPIFLNMERIEEKIVSEWDLESTTSLFRLYEKYGPKWTQIAK